jgi:leucyl-tRNA synthetase
MHEQYHPQEIEAAVQAEWQSRNAFRVTEDASKPKFYACSMLPYPSGKLHMGHVRNYTINDVMTRYMRMRGYNVLMPMGWDAFGLPAENAAIDNGVPPAKWTRANIADMKAQMQPLGLAFDWSREVATCDPSYYKWNQWLFLKMLEKGIAYRKTQIVNWDPVDNTVLANEQVIDGRGWRSGAIVEKREIPGYYLKITDYAEELLGSVVDDLSGWPERVRLMQENWIGKSMGAEIHFPLADGGSAIKVFSTRADTLYGATYLAVAAEHPIATKAAESDPAIQAFVTECKHGGVSEVDLATQEKKGMPTGAFAIHPLTQEKLPIWVANYVLWGYGEGAVMGVPAHDERDFAFAKKYGLPIIQVVDALESAEEVKAFRHAIAREQILEIDDQKAARIAFLLQQISTYEFTTDRWQDWYADDGVAINSGDFNGKPTTEVQEKIALVLKTLALGEPRTTYRLRDWGISRQRYWGTPIPIIHCAGCGEVPVPYKDLPVVLPEDLVPDGSGNPLNKCEAFLHVDCPKCGKPAKRETDTMDTFVDSAWYYMRYCSPDATEGMVDARNDYWMPMDQYIGGIEHAVLHLLYARFWTRVMRDLGLVKFDEPFTKLFTQGMLLNECFYREDASGKRRWFYPGEVDVRHDDKGKPIGALAKEDGQPVLLGGIEKMSKSKNNVVEPRDIINRYGADTARLFSMFAGPPEQSAAWSDSGVEGAQRFLKRLWAYVGRQKSEHGDIFNLVGPDFSRFVSFDFVNAGKDVKALRREIHSALAQASFDYQRLQYNTVVSAAMKMLNALDGFEHDGEGFDAIKAVAVGSGKESILNIRTGAAIESIGILLRVLYPIAPHITNVLWKELGYLARDGDLLDAPWPEVDAAALRQDEIELVIQVNGKLRGNFTVPAKATREDVEELARSHEAVMRHVGTATIKKVIVVPGRLVNIVV